MASPFLSSIRSRKTSTVSPTFSSASSPALANSRSGMRPSDLRPTSTTTASLSIATTRPRSTLPSRLSAPPRLSSSRAAKDSLTCGSAAIWELIYYPFELTVTGLPVVSGGLPGSGPGFALIILGLRRAHALCRASCPFLDNCHGSGKSLVRGQVRRIQDDGVCCRTKWSDRAITIPGIAGFYLGQDVRVYSSFVAREQLQITTLSSNFLGGRHEELHVGIGTDNRADVPAIQHRATKGSRRPLGKTALKVQECGTHRRMGRHLRGSLSDSLAA